MSKPRCRDCGATHEEHKTILEVCPDQKGRTTFETHYRPLQSVKLTEEGLKHWLLSLRHAVSKLEYADYAAKTRLHLPEGFLRQSIEILHPSMKDNPEKIAELMKGPTQINGILVIVEPGDYTGGYDNRCLTDLQGKPLWTS